MRKLVPVHAVAVVGILLVGCQTPQPRIDAQADRLRRQDRHGEAFAAYARAMCADTDNLDVARHLVESWDQLGRPGTPMVPLEGCELPGHVGSYIEGLAAGADGVYGDAEHRLAEAARSAPATAQAEIAYRRGLVRLAAGEHRAAAEHLSRAAGLEPARADIRVGLARVDLAAGDYAAVAERLRGMLAAVPTPKDIHNGRQILAAAVRAAEGPVPQGVEATLAEVLTALERPEVDTAQLHRALQLADRVSHPRVLTVAGIAALSHGLDERGAELLRLAATISPLNPEPLRTLGFSLVAADSRAEALGPLREAFARDPLDAQLAAMLASVAQTVEQLDVARDALVALTALEPETSEHLLGLAHVERRRGRIDAAAVAAERAYAIDPKSIPLLYQRATIQLELAHSAPTEQERDSAASRTRQAVADLLAVSPEHPGAAKIMLDLESRSY